MNHIREVCEGAWQNEQPKIVSGMMTDLTDMNSEELIKEYARTMYREGCGKQWQNRLAFILAAIRKAVVKELSVGVVMTYTTLDGPDGNEHIRTDWHIIGNYPQDGTFDLVPRVTP